MLSHPSDNALEIANDVLKQTDAIIVKKPNQKKDVEYYATSTYDYNNNEEYYTNIEGYRRQLMSELRNMTSQLAAEYHMVEPNKYIAFFDATVDLTKKSSTAHCGECAFVTMAVIEEKAAKGEIKNFNVEVVEVERPDSEYRKNHVFVILNRPKGSDLNNSKTWGKTTVVCDAWEEDDNRVYLAEKHHDKFPDERLKQYEFPINILPGDFYESYDELEEMPPLVTLEYVKENRNSKFLIQTFHKQLKLNEAFVKKYEKELEKICNRLLEPSVLKATLKDLKEEISNFYNILHQYKSHFSDQTKNSGKTYFELRNDFIKCIKSIQKLRSNIAESSLKFLKLIKEEHSKDNADKTKLYTFFNNNSSRELEPGLNQLNDIIKEFKKNISPEEEIDLQFQYRKA